MMIIASFCIDMKLKLYETLVCRTFLQGDQPFSVALRSGGCARAHPPGVAPEASEEWFDSSEVLMPHAMLWLVWSFPHASWP
jgi:hypothetical protein